MKTVQKAAQAVWIFAIVCALAAAGSGPVSADFSETYENNGFRAVFNHDRTITIEGSAPYYAGGTVEIQLDNYMAGKMIRKYEADVAADGTFRLVTDPVQEDVVSVFVRALPDTTYWLGVRAPGTKEIDRGPAIVRFGPFDPVLQYSHMEDNSSDIRAKWKQYAPVFADSSDPYVTEPVTHPPYASGQLKEQVLLDALNMTKFARYLAGLPEDIRLSPELTKSAQHKAVILERAYNPNDPHVPEKPGDMSEAFFQTGNIWNNPRVWAAENLHYQRLPVSAVVSFMDDPGENNRYSVGHRINILQPNLGEVGFGYTEGYTVMHMRMDEPANGWPEDLPFLAWPAPGYFPTLFANFEMLSIVLNPEQFAPVDPESLLIEVLNTGQATQWRFFQTTDFTNRAGDWYLSKKWIYQQDSDLITFGPNNLQIRPGDELRVKISGLKDHNGQDTFIEYAVRFFDLEESGGAAGTGTGQSGQTNRNGQTGQIDQSGQQRNVPSEKDLSWVGQPIKGMRVIPDELWLAPGEKAQLTVLAEDENGLAMDVTDAATYRTASIDQNKYTVSSQGVVTALKSELYARFPLEVSYGDWTQLIYISIEDPIPVFKDISGHWAQEAIEWAAERRIVRGYDDSTFRPDQPISEAEFLAFFFRYRVDPAMIEGPTTTHWANRIYRFAGLRNMPVLGTDDMSKRDQPITRRQVAEIIAAADGKHFNGDDAIQYVLGKGYSQGKTGATIEGYKGDDYLTRAEALYFSYTLRDVITEIKARPEQPTPASELPPLP
jgi:uncharacterized protein YkwD